MKARSRHRSLTRLRQAALLKKAVPKKGVTDFLSLMGKGKSVWQFYDPERDGARLKFVQKFYEPYQSLSLKREEKIPRVIHWIWLGPDAFPSTSILNLDAWADHHPDWTFLYWTDRERPLPHPKMVLKNTCSGQFAKLQKYLHASDSYAEQSDLLRYAILWQQGGLYVDHDVQCFRCFAPLHQLDLYCGTEVPHRPFLRRAFFICNNLIGARAKHPVFKKCLHLVAKRWDAVGNRFPGRDKDSVSCRVACRTFLSFEDAVKDALPKSQEANAVFPAGYFNQIEGDFGIYAHHTCDTTWLVDETPFERKTRRRLMMLSRKFNQQLFLQALLLFAVLALVFFEVLKFWLK